MSATRWVVVASIPQVDGGMREVLVPARHAREARELLREDPARVDCLKSWFDVRVREVQS